MKSFSAIFDNLTGNLLVDELGCLVHPELNQIDFLNQAKPYLLYQDKDFFTSYGFFHFGVPVKLWNTNFRLTVYFLPKLPDTSIFCTGYALHIFNYGGEDQDESIAALFENLLSTALGTPPTDAAYAEAKIWNTNWGEACVRAVIQNGTEPQIGIGWGKQLLIRPGEA